MEKPAVGIVMGSQSDLRLMNLPLSPRIALPLEWLSMQHRHEPAESELSSPAQVELLICQEWLPQ